MKTTTNSANAQSHFVDQKHPQVECEDTKQIRELSDSEILSIGGGEAVFTTY